MVSQKLKFKTTHIELLAKNDEKLPKKKTGTLNRDLLIFLFRYGIFWMPPGESSHPGGSEYV